MILSVVNSFPLSFLRATPHSIFLESWPTLHIFVTENRPHKASNYPFVLDSGLPIHGLERDSLLFRNFLFAIWISTNILKSKTIRIFEIRNFRRINAIPVTKFFPFLPTTNIMNPPHFSNSSLCYHLFLPPSIFYL